MRERMSVPFVIGASWKPDMTGVRRGNTLTDVYSFIIPLFIH